jgi:hypothetical protein
VAVSAGLSVVVEGVGVGRMVGALLLGSGGAVTGCGVVALVSAAAKFLSDDTQLLSDTGKNVEPTSAHSGCPAGSAPMKGLASFVFDLVSYLGTCRIQDDFRGRTAVVSKDSRIDGAQIRAALQEVRVVRNP